MTSTLHSTLYDVLGVEKSASLDEVRRAYRQRALETHPDKLDPGATEEDKQLAEARFHDVHEAFAVLSDTQKRRAYDVNMNINSNYQARWTHLSAEQARRMKDREEWARQQEVQHQERMKAIREQNRVVREEMRAKAREVVDYAGMVQEMLQELCDQNPEWEARKEQVQRRKEERAKTKPPNVPVPV